MTRTVTLVLVVHDHQPVGNFDSVFAAAYADAYEPFLGFLETHATLRLALHTSGPLLQWIALHHSDYLRRLRALVERDQVEVWGGGFFEPILPAIPEPDRQSPRQRLAGEPLSPIDPPPQVCRFLGRCPKGEARCAGEMPALRQIGPGRLAACH